jgi:hypothetical protein
MLQEMLEWLADAEEEDRRRAQDFSQVPSISVCLEQGVTKRCRLSWLTNSALFMSQNVGGEGGVAWSQPMCTAVHHGAQINFGDLTPSLTYGVEDPGGLSRIWNFFLSRTPGSQTVLRIRILDPGSGAFLTPGSGIRDPEWVFSGSRISDLGSQDHILKSFLTIFLVKSSIIL